MEYALRLRYLARAFVDAQGLTLTQADQAQLLASLNLQDGVVIPAAEFVGPELITRAGFTSAPLDMKIVVRGDSIDVMQGGGREAEGTAEAFLAFNELSATLLGTIASFIGRVPHRLASVQEGLLAEMPREQLERVADSFLRVPRSLQDPKPFEWNYRTAWRRSLPFDDLEEEVNEILQVRRLSGVLHSQQGPSTFDRIRVDLDVNTVPLNTRGRFDNGRIRAFFTSCLQSHARMATVTRQVITEVMT